MRNKYKVNKVEDLTNQQIAGEWEQGNVMVLSLKQIRCMLKLAKELGCREGSDCIVVDKHIALGRRAGSCKRLLVTERAEADEPLPKPLQVEVN